MEQWSAIISSFGFPVACCAAMAWYVKHLTDKFNATIAEMTEQHREESREWQKVVNANTSALESLRDKLHVG